MGIRLAGELGLACKLAEQAVLLSACAQTAFEYFERGVLDLLRILSQWWPGWDQSPKIPGGRHRLGDHHPASAADEPPRAGGTGAAAWDTAPQGVPDLDQAPCEAELSVELMQSSFSFPILHF